MLHMICILTTIGMYLVEPTKFGPKKVGYTQCGKKREMYFQFENNS